uniref:EF-hand domain-containing protein n=1 Tax=uncultured SAR11 cluster alpha proteobacterium H17925_45G17 TaxID=715038 RepID=E7CA39_9PROT|nr:hypothetical protein [uncultured SAR11 cluster alpha proteobacterium H17925_45G17]
MVKKYLTDDEIIEDPTTLSSVENSSNHTLTRHVSPAAASVPCGLHTGTLVHLAHVMVVRQCMGAFTVFDLDNNGVIPTNALGSVLRALGLVPPLYSCTSSSLVYGSSTSP